MQSWDGSSGLSPGESAGTGQTCPDSAAVSGVFGAVFVAGTGLVLLFIVGLIGAGGLVLLAVHFGILQFLITAVPRSYLTLFFTIYPWA